MIAKANKTKAPKRNGKNPIEKKVKEEKLRRYNEAVESAELKGIHLINLSFFVKPEFFGTTAEERAFHYIVESVEPRHNAGDDVAMAIVDFAVFAKRSRTKQMNCKAQYAVIYGAFEKCNSDEVKQFVDRVATFTCYPYFRSIFASMDWAAGTGLPPLPIHKEDIIPKQSQRSK